MESFTFKEIEGADLINGGCVAFSKKLGNGEIFKLTKSGGRRARIVFSPKTFSKISDFAKDSLEKLDALVRAFDASFPKETDARKRHWHVWKFFTRAEFEDARNAFFKSAIGDSLIAEHPCLNRKKKLLRILKRLHKNKDLDERERDVLCKGVEKQIRTIEINYVREVIAPLYFIAYLRKNDGKTIAWENFCAACKAKPGSANDIFETRDSPELHVVEKGEEIAVVLDPFLSMTMLALCGDKRPAKNILGWADRVTDDDSLSEFLEETQAAIVVKYRVRTVPRKTLRAGEDLEIALEAISGLSAFVIARRHKLSTKRIIATVHDAYTRFPALFPRREFGLDGTFKVKTPDVD